VLEQG
jgi:hypothetical protein